MHTILNYAQFNTADSGELIDANLESFQTFVSEHEFNEVTTVNSFSDMTFDFGELAFAVGSVSTTNTFSDLAFDFGAFRFIVDGVTSTNTFSDIVFGFGEFSFTVGSVATTNSFSDLRIGEVIDGWFIFQEKISSWTDQDEVSTTWEVV